eukprot:3338103-Prymnesium_polylepis.1
MPTAASWARLLARANSDLSGRDGLCVQKRTGSLSTRRRRPLPPCSLAIASLASTSAHSFAGAPTCD